MASGLSATFGQTALPRVQTDSKGIIVNASLTMPETIFASFVGGNVEANLKQGGTLLFLGSKNLAGMQATFIKYTTDTFKNSKYSAADLEILPLMTSLWQKSRMFIDNELSLSKDVTALADEKKQLEELRKNEASLIAQGYFGKVFTARQGKFIIDALNDISKKS